MRKGGPYVEGGYNDIDPGLNPALQDHYRITPSPGGPGDQYGRFPLSGSQVSHTHTHIHLLLSYFQRPLHYRTNLI